MILSWCTPTFLLSPRGGRAKDRTSLGPWRLESRGVLPDQFLLPFIYFFLYFSLENNSRRQNALRTVKAIELRRKCSLKALFPFSSKHMLQEYQNPNQNYSIYCTMHDRAGGHGLQRNTKQEGLYTRKGCTGSVCLFLKIFICVFGCLGSWLRHMGSSLWCEGSLVVVPGLRNCSTGA